MNKKLKLITVITIASLMVVSWAIIYFAGTIHTHIYVNYWWQVFMGLAALIYAVLGILTSGKWGWLRSGVGRSVFFISLALFMWGVGQLGWCYYLFTDPTVQSPPSHLLDIADFSAIPLWFVGVVMLARATGARYGLRTTKGRILVSIIIVVMSVVSVYLLVFVARGGLSYFHDTAFWDQVADLGYSIGDAIIATICISYYVLSWKILGGRFKTPIVVILTGFIFLYCADFLYSYLAGKNVYFNGDFADLLYMITISIFGLGVNMLDPSSFHKALVPASPGTMSAPMPPSNVQMPAGGNAAPPPPPSMPQQPASTFQPTQGTENTVNKDVA